MSMFYDPPLGWRYGFPKPYRPLPGEKLEDTLIRDGYPSDMAKDSTRMGCRFLSEAPEFSKEDLEMLKEINQ